MTRAELNTYIDTNITDKTAVDSLTPTNEGEALKEVADYVDQEIQSVKPYKIYSILISQSGISDPTVTTLLENTFTGVITWAKLSTGIYEGTITTTEFTNLKTGFIITPIGVDLNCAAYSTANNKVQIKTWQPSTAAFADGQLNETFFEIRVYP
jgi:hypothetical protein